MAGHTPLSCQAQRVSKISKPQSLHCMSMCRVYECVCLCFPRLLPDVHLFDTLHKRNAANCPSGVQHERTRGPHIYVSCCFCWVNLDPAEVEVLANAVYTSCILQNFIKTAAAAQLPEQMCKERKGWSKLQYAEMNTCFSSYRELPLPAKEIASEKMKNWCVKFTSSHRKRKTKPHFQPFYEEKKKLYRWPRKLLKKV